MKKISKLLIGTNNKGKYKEIRDLLTKYIKTHSTSEFKLKSPREDGQTFKENSIIKSKYFSKKTKLICLADDSGLEIDILDKSPGIYSARWGGKKGDFKKAINKVYKELSKKDKNWKHKKIKARFICALTIYNSNKEIINLAFESMNGLFDNSQTLFIHVDDEKGIIDAVNFSKNFDIKNIVIIGGYQAHLISKFLVKNNVAVLIQHTHSLPNFEDEDYNSTYINPKKLINAGVLVGIHTGEASNFQTRNLPFYAGQVAAQGIDKEIALQLITSNTAKILRIDKTLGTLEVGKSATLFVSKGDALDMKSNQLTNAYISGRKVSLETHQTELWKRYSKKYKLSN